MTSFGRGRGWLLQKREQDLRRPGTILYTNDVVTDILNKLSTHGISELVPPKLIQEIVDLISKLTKKDSLRYCTVFSICATIVLFFFSAMLYILEKHATCFGSNPYSTTLSLQG